MIKIITHSQISICRTELRRLQGCKKNEVWNKTQKLVNYESKCYTAHIVDFIIDRWRRYELKLNKIVKPKFRTFRSFRTQLSLSKISRKVFTIFNNGSISFVFPVTVEVNIHPQCPYFQLMLIFIRKMTSLKLNYY